MPAEAQPLPAQARLVDYGIRGMHLAYDLLEGYDALVLIDARPGPGTPGELVVLEIGADDVQRGEFDAHGMDPVAVLAALPDLGGAAAADLSGRLPAGRPQRRHRADAGRAGRRARRRRSRTPLGPTAD